MTTIEWTSELHRRHSAVRQAVDAIGQLGPPPAPANVAEGQALVELRRLHRLDHEATEQSLRDAARHATAGIPGSLEFAWQELLTAAERQLVTTAEDTGAIIVIDARLRQQVTALRVEYRGVICMIPLAVLPTAAQAQLPPAPDCFRRGMVVLGPPESVQVGTLPNYIDAAPHRIYPTDAAAALTRDWRAWELEEARLKALAEQAREEREAAEWQREKLRRDPERVIRELQQQIDQLQKSLKAQEVFAP